MEKFKAVEKEMKTKAFSKEGLSAAAKLDPEERKKQEACDFLSSMVEELERQIETLEAEEDSLQATVKKGKKDSSKADRLSEIGRLTERHKWHQGKLELLLRSLENGNVETDQVNEREEGIRYYVEENQSVEFMEDDTIYDDLNLEEDEGAFGMNNDNDRVSSQDAQSIQDDLPDTADGRGPSAGGGGKPKSSSVSEPQAAAARRPSNQLKSPLPALATLHTPLGNVTNGVTNNAMKPAPLPTRLPGETLKYASAAAAAAASDRNAAGIAPLPPPPSAAAPPGITSNNSLNPSQSTPGQKSSATTSPSAVSSVPTSVGHTPVTKTVLPAVSNSEALSIAPAQAKSPVPAIANTGQAINGSANNSTAPSLERQESQPSPPPVKKPSQPSPNDVSMRTTEDQQPKSSSAEQLPTEESNGEPLKPSDEDESIYHLPPGLHDLIQSFEATKSRASSTSSPSIQRLLGASHATCPDYLDAERPRHYRPQTKYNTPRYYPQEPFVTIDDPALYGKIDTDTLFYIFYYRQNTYQQYMAAKSLKNQSWRFHKQYQTWFQRHEEPKTITEEYEQGTYRFFDYESTWYGVVLLSESFWSLNNDIEFT